VRFPALGSTDVCADGRDKVCKSFALDPHVILGSGLRSALVTAENRIDDGPVFIQGCAGAVTYPQLKAPVGLEAHMQLSRLLHEKAVVARSVDAVVETILRVGQLAIDFPQIVFRYFA